MKMIGISIRSTATRFCSSRPLMSGRVTSSTRQLGAKTRGLDRNSCADSNVSGCQPAESISNSSDLRTETSSSTTNTIGVAPEIGDDIDSQSSAFAEVMSSPVSCQHSNRGWLQAHSRASGERRNLHWAQPPLAERYANYGFSSITSFHYIRRRNTQADFELRGLGVTGPPLW